MRGLKLTPRFYRLAGTVSFLIAALFFVGNMIRMSSGGLDGGFIAGAAFLFAGFALIYRGDQ